MTDRTILLLSDMVCKYVAGAFYRVIMFALEKVNDALRDNGASTGVDLERGLCSFTFASI